MFSSTTKNNDKVYLKLVLTLLSGSSSPKQLSTFCNVGKVDVEIDKDNKVRLTAILIKLIYCGYDLVTPIVFFYCGDYNQYIRCSDYFSPTRVPIYEEKGKKMIKLQLVYGKIVSNRRFEK